VQQLLWLETLIKFLAGSALALAPLTTLRVLGLPRAETGFWPRVCGALLVGMGAASFLEGAFAGRGLGLGGSIVINLCGVAVLASLLVLDSGPTTLRGRTAVWLTVCALVFLSVLELAVV
jgi:hypothetical protein